MTDEAQKPVPVLARRELQAQVIKPIYEEMVETLGEEQAQGILDRAVRKAAIAEAESFANQAPDGGTSLKSFVELLNLWTQGGALEIEVHHQSEERFDFDVTRCRYAEMYREMGLGHIGHLMSCNRDGAFCEGYDSNLELTREHTIMGGAPTCTFRYRYKSADE